MLKGLLTGLSTARAALRDAQQVRTETRAELQTLAKAMTDLVERLEALESAHRKLRGKIYGDGLHRAPAELHTREERRADAFRRVGFVPGKPAKLES